MIALLVLAASQQPLPFYERARELALALPPPGPWTCEALARHTYCCPKGFAVRWAGNAWVCVNKTDAAATRRPVVIARVEGDSL